MDQIDARTLACGLPLIVENMPGVRSVGITWLLPVGAATDPASMLGRSAVLEEMLLRGAGEHDSKSQADAFDRIGVGRSVSGGKVFVRIGASLVADQLDDALPLLVDMVRRPTLGEDAFEPSRDLALQSIDALNDDPHQRASESAQARHLPSPLSRSVLGTPDGLAALTRDAVASAWSELAVPRGSVLALAGAVDAGSVAAQIDSLLEGWTGKAELPEPAGSPERGYAHEPDDSSQVQIMVMHDAPDASSAGAVLERVVVSVLGGGMSSRLFTEVREKRSLCYAVSAGYSPDKHFGTVTAYVGTTPERAQESLDVLMAELTRINASGITQGEFDRAVVGLKSGLVFSGESSSARAGALAGDMYRIGRPRSLDERASEIDAVTLSRVNDYLGSRELGRVTIQTLGPSELTPPAA